MEYDNRLPEDSDFLKCYRINQQDNMLFRQIRLITGDTEKYNSYIIFVDCKGGKAHKEAMIGLVHDGLWIGDRHYVVSERSASMVRTSILSFVDESISEELTKRVTMDLDIGKTVLSKWYAYRGLMLSSCHCIEDWYPRIIIVPDYEKVLKNQNIKYVYDNEITLTNKETGEPFPWKQKDIAVGIQDIKINVFDGCGIHHPDITDTVRGILDSKTTPTSILWRAPFIKGVTHEMNYVEFFQEHGITEITDVWGIKHDVSPTAEPAIIMCESMYKGLKYFKHYKDERDWKHYWDEFRKYNHCIGVAKWNFSLEEEPIYTRGNYQVFQDLDLPYEEFRKLAQDSCDLMEGILNGDKIALYVFLGLFADSHKGLNLYMEALTKNSEMIKEEGVYKYVKSLVKKTIDEMKCGKLYLKACFKFEAPDLIMLMEHIGGLPPIGCLKEDEFFAFNRNGKFDGEYLIERNPHICRSEHVILKATNNDLTDKYCSHLVNVCMVNGNSLVAQRLNGSDFDGDLVLVVDNEMMMRGVHRDIPIVIDIEDKVTVLEEEDIPENKAKAILRGENSLIGETSNCATTYHNKVPKSLEQKQKYESYIDLLSVINGKAIDSAKTGVIYKIPRHIAKYAKPLPYFMKYASPYYAKMKTMLKSQSNMNRLCWDLEHWHNQFKRRRRDKTFDYTIMIDQSIPVDEDKMDKIDQLYKSFREESDLLVKTFQKTLCRTANHSDKNEYATDVNWKAFYNKYRLACFDICPDICELANYCVKVCYERHISQTKNFMWVCGGEGILANLKQVEQYLPMRNPNGEYEYLGNRYSLEKIMFDK